MDLITLSGLTVSLDRILVDSVFGASVTIVHSDRESRRRRQSRRRAAVAIVRLVRRLLRRKTTPRYDTLYTGGAPGPPEAPMGRTEADAVSIVDSDRQSFDGLNKRIAGVAIT